jgi:hypothetical protein
VSEQLIFINRGSGVAHADFWCDALDGVPTECLRVEAYDPDRPRRKCSRCWNGYPGGGGHRAARGRGRSGGSRVTLGVGAARGVLAVTRHGLQGPDAPLGARGLEAGAAFPRAFEGSDLQGSGASPSQCEIVPGGLVTPPGTTDLGR